MKIKKVYSIVLAAFLTILPVTLFAAWNSRGNCFNGPGFFGRYSHFFGGGLIMMIISLTLLGFTIFFAYKYFRNNNNSAKADNPLEILKLRYVKGEISKEEYDNIRKDI